MKKKLLINKAVSLIFIMSMIVMTLMPALNNNSTVVSASSENTKEHKRTIKITVAEPTFKAYKEYQIAKIENYNSTDEPSAPMLPVKTFSLAIPMGAEVKNIKATHSKKRDLKGNFDIFPAQNPVPISKSSQAQFTPKDPSIYSSSKQFPGKLFEYAGEGNLRDQRILSVNVYPLQYNPAGKKLTFYENIEIEVTYIYDKTRFIGSEKTNSDEFASMAKKIVSNPEDVEMSSVVTEEATGLLPLENVEHVIITSDALKAEFQILADHKISRGVSSKVVTLEETISAYEGIDDQEKIRNFIKDARVSWDTIWVLLGGDTNVIPHRLAYNTYYRSEYIPADLYYSDLDGSWDADGDLIYGETTDDVDLYPDVFVGRAPVDTTGEANTFVGKTITYESGPSGYETSALFLAEYLDTSTDGGETKDMIEGESIPSNFSVTNLYSSLGNLSHDSAVTELNKGYGIVNHIGHANYYVLSIGSGGLDNTDMDSLNNFQKSSVFYSEGCWSNALDRNSVAEHFILNPNGGGIAYVGNSRYGWYSPGSPGYGPSDRFDRAFFDSLFNKGIYDIGMTFADSKAVYRSSSTYNSVYRYLQFSLNLLGDPETTIWTVSTPEPPALSVIAESPDKVNIDTSFVVNAIISNSGTEMATGVGVGIDLPTGLSTADPINYIIGNLGGKESELVSWNISVGSNPGVYDITVNASIPSISFASDTITVEVVLPDFTKPTITLEYPSDNAEVEDDDTVTFQYIPTDESGIASCELVIGGEIYGRNYEIVNGATNEFAISWLDAGEHFWRVSCVDDSLQMNEKSSEERALIVKDVTPPMDGYIDIMDMGAGSANGGYTSDNMPDLYLGAYGANYMALSCDNVAFSGWIDFPEDKYYYIYSHFNLETGPGCTAGDGPKTVYVKFKDEAGNVEDSVNDTTILDTTAPVITTITGDVSGTTGDKLEISLTAFDAGEIAAAVIYIDGDEGIVMGKGVVGNTFMYSYTVPAGSVAPHTYYVEVYDVVENSSYSPGTGTYIITVTDDDAPFATAIADPQSVLVSETVIFDASRSSDNIGIASYSWDFGDGTTGSGVTTAHTYNSPGSIMATLTVTDNAGMTATDTVEITVIPDTNQPPVADAGPNQTVNDTDGDTKETVFLDGSGSEDSDGSIVSYKWFEDMDTNPICTSVLPECECECILSVGAHTITLVVADNDGVTDTDEVIITVNPNQPPIANAGEDQISFVGATVSFNGSSSTDLDGSINTYNWNFGDGGTGTGTLPTHIYSSAGTYTAMLTVTDNGGASVSDTVIVQVNATDVVAVTKAQFDSKKKVLIVQATSSAGDEAELVVQGFGLMSYNADRNLFTLTTYCTENPVNITVSSDLGGSTKIAVTNKFKER